MSAIPALLGRRCNCRGKTHIPVEGKGDREEIPTAREEISAVGGLALAGPTGGVTLVVVAEGALVAGVGATGAAVYTAKAATFAEKYSGSSKMSSGSDPKGGGEGSPAGEAPGSSGKPVETPAGAAAAPPAAPRASAPHKFSGMSVADILKTKKGSIKGAPLEPGAPGWDEFAKMSREEIQAGANSGLPDFRTAKKLLTDERFDK